MEDIVTTNLGDFGYREKKLAGELLIAMSDQGLPDDFYDDAVTVAMNRNSGYVFLTNSDYQVAMMNGDKLETFYFCPICGAEGFKDEIVNEENHSSNDMSECKAWIKEIK